MKEGFRQCMAWLHTWTGLIVGWLLFFVFLTGTAGYFNHEIDCWMRPERVRTQPSSDTGKMISLAQGYLAKEAAGAESWRISLPDQHRQADLRVSWQPAKQADGKESRSKRQVLDQYTGAVLTPQVVRKTGGGQFLYRMHYELHYFSYDLATTLVGICTMLMLLAIVSGVITHKKIFTDFFTFRPGKGQRSWLDAHNVISVTALPFFLLMTYSGLVFFMYSYMPAGVAAVYGTTEQQSDQFFDELYPRPHIPASSSQALLPILPLLRTVEAQWGQQSVSSVSVAGPGNPAAVISFSRRNPQAISDSESMEFSVQHAEILPPMPIKNDATRTVNDVMLGLHEGTFAGPVLRWLYFLSGLLGCAMIATGLVLWTVKRKIKQDKRLKAGQKIEFGFRLVECLNISTIAGLPVAIAAYFWANRLIPVAVVGRDQWEAHCIFIVWGLLLLYSALRPARRAWFEVFCAAALAYALLPLLNALTSDRHLGRSLATGDWPLAGFDLTMLALGGCFAVIALKLYKKFDNPVSIRTARPVVLATESAL